MKLAFVDMDSTLAHFTRGMDKALEALMGPDEDLNLHAHEHENVPHIKARRKLIKNAPGFWRNLEPIADGFQIVRVLKDLGYSIHVLSKGPPTAPIAWKEKLEWCQEHLPGVPVTITADKAITRADILVDDWPAYIHSWLLTNPTSGVIVPSWDWNKDLSPDDRIHHFHTEEPIGSLKLREWLKVREERAS